MKRVYNKELGNGTSYFGISFYASVNDLINICGTPIRSNDINKKSQYDWTLKTNTDKIFTIYDWKEYRRFNNTEIIKWNIGGYNIESCLIGLNEIMFELSKNNCD